ncbi:MAG: aminodeoxychorismate/anthranilate synthase component II [Deltaproteobacteria bacterium]|nr:aminodeoxychorismate/anthranilate synthase component II [Candidatus Zymogenaceae bacterium]
MILVIDNYDSFTYNLVQYLGEMGTTPAVFRNDAITADRARELSPEYIVISPGPGIPQDAGVSIDLIRQCTWAPILGVCLGHQAIGAAFGARIIRAKRIMHGKCSPVYHDRGDIFTDIPRPFCAARYHSLVIDPHSVPDCLEVTATTDDEEIMAVRHRQRPVFGIQFHPESIMTEHGRQILKNFLLMGGTHD